MSTLKLKTEKAETCNIEIVSHMCFAGMVNEFIIGADVLVVCVWVFHDFVYCKLFLAKK